MGVRAAARAVLSRTLAGGLAAILLFSSPLAAQKKIERKLPLGMEGALRVVNMVGSVVVHGWNKDTVLVRGTLAPGDNFFMGGGYTGAKMFVESLNDRDPKPTRLEIWVPARVRLWIKTATANIDVSDVSGGLERSGAFDFDSHSGSIDIAIPDRTGATFSVVTIAGSITNNLSRKTPISGRFGRGAELSSEESGGGAKVSVRTFKGPVTLRRIK